MSGGRGVGVALGGLAALLLALAVASGWQGTTRLVGRGDDRTGAEHAARTFAEAYGTFDARDADAYRDRLLPLTTGRLRSALLQLTVDPAAVAQAHTLTTRVVGVQLTALHAESAVAVVTVEQQRASVDPATGGAWEDRVRGRLTCRLVRDAGRWLVEDIRLVPVESPAPPRPE